MADDELFRIRWELLELRHWTSFQPHPTDPEKYGDTLQGWTSTVTPADRPAVEYTSVEEALRDGWEPFQVDPPVNGHHGSSQTWWFRRSYEDFVFGE